MNAARALWCSSGQVQYVMIHWSLLRGTLASSRSIIPSGTETAPATWLSSKALGLRTSTIMASPLSRAARASSTVMRGTSASVCGRLPAGCVNEGSTIAVGASVGRVCVGCALQAGSTKSITSVTKRNRFVPSIKYLGVESLQLAIAIHTFTDDRQAVIPELALGDINAEAFGKFGGCIFAGGGEQ